MVLILVLVSEAMVSTLTGIEFNTVGNEFNTVGIEFNTLKRSKIAYNNKNFGAFEFSGFH